MASAYLHLPKSLMNKIEKLTKSTPNLAGRVLGAGTGAVYEKMVTEFKKAANKGYSTGYTVENIIMRSTTNSTPSNPEIFIGAIDETAASRMKYIESGRVKYRNDKNKLKRIQEKRPYMGKIRKFMRSKECKALMEYRFKKIIGTL